MIAAAVEITVILLLVVANGLLAGTEIALVTSRKARLNRRAREGHEGSRKALELVRSPSHFLSTVQIGITSVAVMAGAFGGTRLAATVAPGLAAVGVPPRLIPELAIVIVVVGITYLTLVIGELVPKRIALHDPERMAAHAAGPMQSLARLATPVVRLLAFSTDTVLGLLGFEASEETEITEEEITAMIAHATEAGVLEATEQQIVERLFLLSDTTVDVIMTPRKDIVWIDRTAGPAGWSRAIGSARHTRYLVIEEDLDGPLHYVVARDLLRQIGEAGEAASLEGLLREPHVLPPWTPVFRLLELFQWSGDHIAVVQAEDRVAGLVTLTDVLAGIVGDMPPVRHTVAPGVVERADGSWLVDGLIPFARFAEHCGREDPTTPDFPTLHAFMVDRLDHHPERAAVVRWRGLRLEVVDMDGSRVDQILVTGEDGGAPRSDDELLPAPEG